MKKLVLTTLFAVATVFLLVPLAFAQTCPVYQSIDRTNTLIQSTIDRAIVTADRLVSRDSSPDSTITRLITATDAMAARLITYASRSGVCVVSDYNKVRIGGQTAWVDPCRVLNR
jgi:hypothetical protein